MALAVALWFRNFTRQNGNFADTVNFFQSLNSEIYDFYLVSLKFREDFTPNLTNVEISEP